MLRPAARPQRTGANSILPIHKRAPTLTLAADDILYIDLGPIFDQTIEADFARTYVIGVRAPRLVNEALILHAMLGVLHIIGTSGLLLSDSMVHTIAGNDPQKLRLAAVLPKIFAICKREYLANPDQTGAEFYAFVCKCVPRHRLHKQHACTCSAHM